MGPAKGYAGGEGLIAGRVDGGAATGAGAGVAAAGKARGAVAEVLGGTDVKLDCITPPEPTRPRACSKRAAEESAMTSLIL